MATLYIVSTPIGNLGDMTYRAVEVLGSVARVLAEDTRRTRVLLQHYDIHARLVSAHEHNEAARAQRVVEWLDAGDDLALVTDAGTPLVSDPGLRIVQRVLDAGHQVVPVPGASAALAALVASGLEPEPFTFLGFAPRTGRARRERLEEIAVSSHAVVLYESPNRLAALLADLSDLCGGERRVAVARELTKLHETVFRGTLAEASTHHAGEVRGEVVVVLAGREPATASTAEADEAAARALAGSLLAEGRRPSQVARDVARRLRLPRNRAYEITQSLVEEPESEP
ncbi:MAG: 16S rRNA (cytidine(1402)-2'-O)-methyltransferase [Gemmatimonadota bacterium]|jgi:16S rRNA (cytidine1402-2'-O)-methyltransferase